MKITKRLFVFWHAAAYLDGGGQHFVADYDMPKHDNSFTLLCTKDVEFDVPEVDARGMMIDSLKRQKDEVIKEATAKARQYDEQIQQLLALDAPVAA